MVTFVGIDLSWTGRNESGICVLEETDGVVQLVRLEAVVVSAEAIARQMASIPGELVVAVDAPLIRTPACTAERELGRAFSRYRAPAYTASVSFLADHGLMAGPELGAALREERISLFPFGAGTAERVGFETYPHALHVLYFGLTERILYKKGPLIQRREGIRLYQRRLHELLAADLPLVATSQPFRDLVDPGAVLVGGAGLKHLEDKMDGLTCAYAAWRAYRDGIEMTDVFGDPRFGAIVIPGMGLDSRFVPGPR
jgi:predicted RNase H-like nuclease